MNNVELLLELNFESKYNLKQLESDLRELVIKTRQEEGCIEYKVYKSLDSDYVYFFKELWATDDSLENHRRGTAVRNFKSNAGAHVIEKRVFNPPTQ